MKRTLLYAAICVALSACTAPHPQTITRVVTPPPLLMVPVAKPAKPNPKTATQKDVAIFIVEQNAAIDACNARLNIIKKWSKNQHGYR